MSYTYPNYRRSLIGLIVLFLGFIPGYALVPKIVVDEGIAYAAITTSGSELSYLCYDLKTDQTIGTVSQASGVSAEAYTPHGVVFRLPDDQFILRDWKTGDSRMILDVENDLGLTDTISSNIDYSKNWVVGFFYGLINGRSAIINFKINLSTGLLIKSEAKTPSFVQDFTAEPNLGDFYLSGSGTDFTLWSFDADGLIVLSSAQMLETEFGLNDFPYVSQVYPVTLNEANDLLWSHGGKFFTYPDLEFVGAAKSDVSPVFVSSRIYVKNRGSSAVEIFDDNMSYQGRVVTKSLVAEVGDEEFILTEWDGNAYAVYYRSGDDYIGLNWDIKAVRLNDVELQFWDQAIERVSIGEVGSFNSKSRNSVYELNNGNLLFSVGEDNSVYLVEYDPVRYEIVNITYFPIRNVVGLVVEKSGDSLLIVTAEEKIYRYDLSSGSYYPLINFLDEIYGAGVIDNRDIIVSTALGIWHYSREGLLIEFLPHLGGEPYVMCSCFGSIVANADASVYRIGYDEAYFGFKEDGSIKLLKRGEVDLSQFKDLRENRTRREGLILTNAEQNGPEVGLRILDDSGSLVQRLPELDDFSPYGSFDAVWTEQLIFIYQGSRAYVIETENYTEVMGYDDEAFPHRAFVYEFGDGDLVWLGESSAARREGGIVPYTSEDIMGTRSPLLDVFGGRVRETGYSWSEAMGWYYLEEAPWIYVLEFGWVYAQEKADGASYVYFPAAGWVYINPSIFPTVYDYTRNEWVYYAKWSKSPRWMYSWERGYWVDDLAGFAPASLAGREILYTAPDLSEERWGFEYSEIDRNYYANIRFFDTTIDQMVKLRSRYEYERVSDRVGRVTSNLNISGVDIEMTGIIEFSSEISGIITFNGIGYYQGKEVVVSETGPFVIQAYLP